MNPLFSIVMPTYCREEAHLPVVEACLTSIEKHSKDYELILIDNGSTYTTPLFSLATTLIRQKENIGVAPAWNNGIKIARGKYIAVINDDIEVPENWLQALKTTFSVFPKAGVVAPRVEHLPDPVEGMEERVTWFPGSCFMLTPHTLQKVGYFDERFVPFNCEDVDYWERILQAEMTMARNYNVFVKHREGDVVHKLDYEKVNDENVKRLIAKWGYDPRPKFYQ